MMRYSPFLVGALARLLPKTASRATTSASERNLFFHRNHSRSHSRLLSPAIRSVRELSSLISIVDRPETTTDEYEPDHAVKQQLDDLMPQLHHC